MMRIHSKKLVFVFLGVLVTTTIFLFSRVLASNSIAEKENFCNRFPEIAEKINQRIAGHQTKIEAKKAENQIVLDNKRKNRDEQLEELRKKGEKNFLKHFEELEKQAKTDAQKQAVANFKVAVQSAILARNIAIDDAIQNFRKEIDKALAQRKSDIQNVLDDFKKAKEAALEKAKHDCVSGVDSKAVRNIFWSQLKVAQEKFKADIRAIEKRNDWLHSLVAARKEAIDKARQEFRGAVKKALADFKIAFGFNQ